MSDKLKWSGTIVSIQPRIRLSRSFDQRSHSYLGYSLQIRGTIDDHTNTFTLGIGKALKEKHKLQLGDEIQGVCLSVENPDLETVGYYMVSKFKVIARSQLQFHSPPPWLGIPPSLEVYRERGHRRLAPQTYEVSCRSCIWGCHMAVEMIIDHWNPSLRKYRQETFCYGPKSCKLYKSGPPRRVPGRKGMSWTEENWVDEDATSNRTDDE
jgi:hypothetical protein